MFKHAYLVQANKFSFLHLFFKETSAHFKDENYQFYREKYQTVLIFKEKCDLLIQDLKVIFNVSSANVSLAVL